MEKWLEKLSPATRKEARKVLEITLKEIELYHSNEESNYVRIPYEDFKEENISRTDVVRVISKVDAGIPRMKFLRSSEIPEENRYGDLVDLIRLSSHNLEPSFIVDFPSAVENSDTILLELENIDKLRALVKEIDEDERDKKAGEVGEAKTNKGEENEGEGDGKEKIEKITLIDMERNEDEYKVAVNEDWQNAVTLQDSKFGNELTRAIKDRDNPNCPLEVSEYTAEYPKYNIRCVLYRSGKYSLTEIFTGYGQDPKFNPDIITEIISEDEFQRRENDFS